MLKRPGVNASRVPPPPSPPVSAMQPPQPKCQKEQDPVVASLPKKAPHPYSAIALSPTRKYAVAACNDTLQILSVSPKGLHLIQTVPLASHFSTSSSSVAVAASSAGFRSPFQRPLRISEDLFDVPNSQSNHGAAKTSVATSPGMMMHVTINDVAWSHDLMDVSPTRTAVSSSSSARSSPTQLQASTTQQQHHQFIAAAGSNGAIAIWNAKTLLQKQVRTLPEVVLTQHARAVNRLSWHPKRQILLSASSDATVRLWERKINPPVEGSGGSQPSAATSASDSSETHKNISNNPPNSPGGGNFRFSLFGQHPSAPPKGESNTSQNTASSQEPIYTWQCTGVFEPRSEAVRDVSWNPSPPHDLFAICTSSGSLVVYNRFVRAKYVVKLAAHDRDATTLDWHPTRPHILATGGSGDRVVKVWNLGPHLVGMGAGGGTTHSNTSSVAAANESAFLHHQNTVSSRGAESTHTDPSDANTDSSPSWGSRASGTFGSGKTNPLSRQPAEHVLTIAASVKRVKWRLPDVEQQQQQDDPSGLSVVQYGDRHESMLVVATAPVKGETGAGAGMVALWSYHRPYMPLSVVEGHESGPVMDVVWLDTPVLPVPTNTKLPSQYDTNSEPLNDGLPAADSERMHMQESGLWQHVLSVGKDRRCLIQSLARGDRPISRVPPYSFAMANLSPFYTGYGSLQIFSFCQEVGSSRQGSDDDFWLTSLRQDHMTAMAPGIFQEKPPPPPHNKNQRVSSGPRHHQTPPHSTRKPIHHRIPRASPMITFNVVDQGDLNQTLKPDVANDDALVVAPEVVHLSRFAALYKFYPTPELPTRVHLCMHNAQVAQDLQNDSQGLAHMWTMIGVLLEMAGIDSFAKINTDRSSKTPQEGQCVQPDHSSAIQYSLFPTVAAILEERANNGDVQTCVALCETLEVLDTDHGTKIPGLEIQLVREWYLSYIDLLRDMCLFSHACSVIRNCKDPFVSALNTKSTTISESCPNCGKAMKSDGNESMDGVATVRRTCKSCRKRVGKCFLCHEPVKGMFVWCPGCGHGGHLEHALSWFGGLRGGAVREECPTGCGHRCNILQTVNAFPRTDSVLAHDTGM